jgi:hypothetical protein
MCLHTTAMCVSAYYCYVCVCILLLHMCPHATAMCVPCDSHTTMQYEWYTTIHYAYYYTCALTTAMCVPRDSHTTVKWYTSLHYAYYYMYKCARHLSPKPSPASYYCRHPTIYTAPHTTTYTPSEASYSYIYKERASLTAKP